MIYGKINVYMRPSEKMRLNSLLVQLDKSQKMNEVRQLKQLIKQLVDTALERQGLPKLKV